MNTIVVSNAEILEKNWRTFDNYFESSGHEPPKFGKKPRLGSKKRYLSISVNKYKLKFLVLTS